VLLDPDPPGETEPRADQYARKRGPIAHGETDPGHGDHRAGIGGVGEPAIRAGVDQPMVVLRGDNDPEEAAECADRPEPEGDARPDQGDTKADDQGARRG